MTPLYIAFYEDSDDGLDIWTVTIILQDIFFAIDIVVVFFSAFYDDNFYLIDNLKDISIHYVFGWFLLDLSAIVDINWITP